MAVIPIRESQVVPTSEAPSAIAPPKIGSAPWQAVEQAGSEITQIGDAWNKKITEAKQGAEYGAAVAQMHVGLSKMYGDVTNNPAYKLDPDAGQKAWEEQSQKYIADNLGNIKDPHVKQMVQNHANEIWASHTVSMNDWNRKQNIQNYQIRILFLRFFKAIRSGGRCNDLITGFLEPKTKHLQHIGLIID